MHIYLKNNPATFYPDLIWNHGALAVFEEGHPYNKNKNKTIRDQFMFRQLMSRHRLQHCLDKSDEQYNTISDVTDD